MDAVAWYEKLMQKHGVFCADEGQETISWPVADPDNLNALAVSSRPDV